MGLEALRQRVAAARAKDEPPPEVVMARADEQVASRNGSHPPPLTEQRPAYLPDIHRLLPQSPEAEQGVLASFLIAPDDVGATCATRGLAPRHFHIPAHATIYERLLYLHAERMPCDFITLGNVLRSEGQWDQVGGAPFITHLFTFLPTAANVGHYIDTVMEKHSAREGIRLTTDAATDLYDPTVSPVGRLSELREAVQKIEERSGAADQLIGRAFDIHDPPPEPPPVFKLGDHVIATPENFMMIQAKIKAGKTALIGALIGSTMSPTGDCLGMASDNPKELAVIHFDTEQSRFHHFCVIKRALWRAGRDAPPDWLRSYYVKGLSVQALWDNLRSELKRAQKEHGGIHSVILDGIGDFCLDVNDAAEANQVVAELERLSVDHHTVFVCVLHENPGSDIGKTRGHLGSYLERKAETNLRMEKDADGVTVVYSDRARTAHIPKQHGVCFAWDDEKKVHLSTETKFVQPARTGGVGVKGVPRINSRIVAAKAKLGRAFARNATVRRSALIVSSGVPEKSFDKYWAELKAAELIIQDPAIKSLWTASPEWSKELSADYPDDENETSQ